MKIGIIGGGSIGLLFTHYLNKHHDVCIYTHSAEQARYLEKEDLILERDQNPIKTVVNAASFDKWNGDEDLTIIAVKQYDLKLILEKIRQVNQSNLKSFLFLQNGMGHLRWLSELSAANIFVGVVEHGALKAEPNRVIHTGVGTTRLALFKGSDVSVLKNLSNPPLKHFSYILESNYEEMLIRKLIVNAVINPLTAALNVPNGVLLENPHYFHLLKKLFDEISLVLNLSNKEEGFIYLKNVCRNTWDNRSSMLRDIDENRQTEVEAILGYVLNEAKQKQINAPLTENYYQLIKGKGYKREGK